MVFLLSTIHRDVSCHSNCQSLNIVLLRSLIELYYHRDVSQELRAAAKLLCGLQRHTMFNEAFSKCASTRTPCDLGQRGLGPGSPGATQHAEPVPQSFPEPLPQPPALQPLQEPGPRRRTLRPGPGLRRRRHEPGLLHPHV